MTAVDERTRAVERERAAREEDFWKDLMPEAAGFVVSAGYGSTKMLQRKMTVGHALAVDLLVELQDAGVVGEPNAKEEWPALVREDGLPALLARLATLADDQSDEEPEDVADVAATPDATPPATPVVSLVKPDATDAMWDATDEAPHATNDEDWEDEDATPGGELVPRLFGRLVPRPSGEFGPWRGDDEVPHLVTRLRQATARGVVLVADQPPVARGIAVGRQAPKAATRLVIWTPRGALRVAIRLREWLTDAESLRLLAKHEAAGEGESYAKVAEARAKKPLAARRWLAATVAGLPLLAVAAWHVPSVFAGLLATLVGLGVVAAGKSSCRNPKELGYLALAAVALGWLTYWQGPLLATLVPRPPVWVWWVALGVAIVVFGVLGRKEDQHLMEMPANNAPHKPPTITAPMVIEALCSLGHSKMKFPEDIRVIMDPHQAGAGVQIDLELGKGVPASYVVKNREPLAASMRHPLGCVWPAVGLRHPGHLSLYISEQVMAEALQKPWPLAEGGAVDIFRPQAQVTDQRGDWVDLVLAYASVVIGAQPRMGKTYLLRQFLLVAGLDVRTKVASLDGKGTGDLSPTRLFADFYSVGDDPEEIEDRVLTFLRQVRSDMRKRAKFIRDLPHEEAPESKVTSELVDRYPHVLAPRVIGIDETQSYFGYGDKKNAAHKAVREEITAIVTDLVKRGPALGIWVILATQNVSEETIPRQISLNAVLRAAMKLFDDSANNMVLGAGAYGKGVDATQFDFTDKGLMWMRGDGDRPFIGRSVVGLDAVAAERIAAKARALRIAAGRLTGEAADDGIVDSVVVVDILDDAENVMAAHRCDKAQYPVLLGWLKELRAEHYDGLTLKELAARMPKGPNGNSRQVWCPTNKENARGVWLSDLKGRNT